MTGRVRYGLGVLGVFLAANTLLNLYRIVPENLVAGIFLPTIEIAIVALVVLLVPARIARRAAWAFAPPLVLLSLYSVGETFYRYIYREAMDPYHDLSFVGTFLTMITGAEFLSSSGVVVVLTVVLVLIVSVGSALALRGLVNRAANVSIGWRAALTAVVVAAWVVRAAAVPHDAPVTVVAVRGLLGNAVPTAPVVERPPAETVPMESPSVETIRQPGLGRSDVTILVVESYGHTLFSREDHRERFAGTYQELAGVLDAADVFVYSAFVRSPAFGGRSWLADGTILSGKWLGNQEIYDAVFDSPDPNLPRDLRDAGYWSAVYAPAMTHFDDLWFDFYPFNEAYVLDRLNYRGPVFEFGKLTDQFLLWRIHQVKSEAHMAEPDRPVFSFAMMISSHVPFRIVPPYVEDWNDLGDGEVYNDLPRIRFDNNWLTGGEYPEGYTTSIAYSLRSAVDYVVQFARPEELVVIIGDHQPRIPISEQESTYSVPAHFMSKDPAVVARLSDRGFTPGLVPDTNPELMWMNEVYPLVMDLLE